MDLGAGMSGLFSGLSSLVQAETNYQMQKAQWEIGKLEQREHNRRVLETELSQLHSLDVQAKQDYQNRVEAAVMSQIQAKQAEAQVTVSAAARGIRGSAADMQKEAVELMAAHNQTILAENAEREIQANKAKVEAVKSNATYSLQLMPLQKPSHGAAIAGGVSAALGNAASGYKQAQQFENVWNSSRSAGTGLTKR